jgi:hypothetical protein
MLMLILACTGADDQTVEELKGIAAMGHTANSIDDVTFEQLVGEDDGLDVPRDLDFNPDRPGELWIVNRADDSVTIVSNAGTADQTTQHLIDPYAEHFMDEVSSIDFGQPGTFGTCHESRNTYNGKGAPNRFMGPTLWSSDMDVFAKSNPAAVEFVSDLFGFYADLGSHLDMLHESPLCVGIEWSNDNVYWVFDGFNNSITRYDFAEDHGPGYDDHSDGIISRYVEDQVAYVADVPSHLVLEPETGFLYVADTGNNRIAILDTASGTKGNRLASQEPGVDHHVMDGGEIWTFIEGSDAGLGQPSGLDMHDGVLYVGDHSNGNLFAFDVETGDLIDWVGTGLTGLMGVKVVSEDEIWVVDADSNGVYRLTP